MKKINVEVAYAEAMKQKIVSVIVNENSTIAEVIQQSNILNEFPEIDLIHNKVGIFSKIKQLSDIVEEGDRIEIYRPLLIEPKEARKAKAKKN